ncbi:hypothetical protein EVAR_52573_1 [Eumeta japonica]|uniref:Uncharacterized protein n=1 Tax=Eumeta variegata TaxID=151549 RepID=A0A4C1YAQ4_EUMVA|nr:hypothetical protein EVAR_52573_1 [Eumeta japonica]
MEPEGSGDEAGRLALELHNRTTYPTLFDLIGIVVGYVLAMITFQASDPTSVPASWFSKGENKRDRREKAGDHRRPQRLATPDESLVRRRSSKEWAIRISGCLGNCGMSDERGSGSLELLLTERKSTEELLLHVCIQ